MGIGGHRLAAWSATMGSPGQLRSPGVLVCAGMATALPWVACVSLPLLLAGASLQFWWHVAGFLLAHGLLLAAMVLCTRSSPRSHRVTLPAALGVLHMLYIVVTWVALAALPLGGPELAAALALHVAGSAGAVSSTCCPLACLPLARLGVFILDTIALSVIAAGRPELAASADHMAVVATVLGLMHGCSLLSSLVARSSMARASTAMQRLALHGTGLGGALPFNWVWLRKPWIAKRLGLTFPQRMQARFPQYVVAMSDLPLKAEVLDHGDRSVLVMVDNQDSTVVKLLRREADMDSHGSPQWRDDPSLRWHANELEAAVVALVIDVMNLQRCDTKQDQLALPWKVVVSDWHVGVLMPYIQGQPLTSYLLCKPDTTDLNARFGIAVSLCALLHRFRKQCGVAHGAVLPEHCVVLPAGRHGREACAALVSLPLLEFTYMLSNVQQYMRAANFGLQQYDPAAQPDDGQMAMRAGYNTPYWPQRHAYSPPRWFAREHGGQDTDSFNFGCIVAALHITARARVSEQLALPKAWMRETLDAAGVPPIPLNTLPSALRATVTAAWRGPDAPVSSQQSGMERVKQLLAEAEASWKKDTYGSQFDRTLQRVIDALAENAQVCRLPHALPLTRIHYRDIEIQSAEKLGQGGFGVVVPVYWQGELCALKEFSSRSARAANPNLEGGSVDKLINEVRIHAMLNHPRILPFLGVVASRSKLGILTQLASSSLRAAVLADVARAAHSVELAQAEFVIQPQHLIRVLRDAAVGLVAMHENVVPIIHNDIKPDNILLTSSECPRGWLCDFGISRVAEWVHAERRLCAIARAGTRGFVSPESSVPGQYVTTASDMWSFGATIAMCITGQNVLREVAASNAAAVLRAWEGVTFPWHMLRCGLRQDAGVIDQTAEVCSATEWHIGALELLGRACTAEDPAQRPTARTAARMLSALVSSASSTSPAEQLEHTFVEDGPAGWCRSWLAGVSLPGTAMSPASERTSSLGPRAAPARMSQLYINEDEHSLVIVMAALQSMFWRARLGSAGSSGSRAYELAELAWPAVHAQACGVPESGMGLLRSLLNVQLKPNTFGFQSAASRLLPHADSVEKLAKLQAVGWLQPWNVGSVLGALYYAIQYVPELRRHEFLLRVLVQSAGRQQARGMAWQFEWVASMACAAVVIGMPDLSFLDPLVPGITLSDGKLARAPEYTAAEVLAVHARHVKLLLVQRKGHLKSLKAALDERAGAAIASLPLHPRCCRLAQLRADVTDPEVAHGRLTQWVDEHCPASSVEVSIAPDHRKDFITETLNQWSVDRTNRVRRPSQVNRNSIGSAGMSPRQSRRSVVGRSRVASAADVVMMP